MKKAMTGAAMNRKESDCVATVSAAARALQSEEVRSEALLSSL